MTSTKTFRLFISSTFNDFSQERRLLQTYVFHKHLQTVIITIHEYCFDVIQTNADIAKIDTKFDMIDEAEKSKILSRLTPAILNDKLNKEALRYFSINHYLAANLYKKDLDRGVKIYTDSLEKLASFYEESNRFFEAMKLWEELMQILTVLYEKNPEEWEDIYTRTSNRLENLKKKT